ncbi:thioredoxin domain-containing protein [Leeuwenhoekiella sp. NPDC079379]|uniref:thioredoxin domain-containing protein n=1 Tax=Leeuwenhoekiella sp. NPDC079379 TaxID=3364122 RepID=UPI0037CC0B2D
MIKKLLVVIILFTTSNSFATNWLHSLEDAQKLALGQNKLILVDFWASWCGPCLKMDKDSWSDPEVQSLMEAFIPVKIDFDRQKNLARSYQVNAIPDFYIMDGNGAVIYHHKGYLNAFDLIRELKKYQINIAFTNTSAIQYYQKQQYNTAFKLAERYMDFSLNISEKEVRLNFLQVAKKYLNKSEDLLVNTMSTYNLFEERIALYDLMIDVYRGKTSKVTRILAKEYPESSIDPRNQVVFYFLKSCLCKPDDSELALVSEKLKSKDVSGNFQTRLQWFSAIE